MVEEQRAAAANGSPRWSKGAESPPAEWDFLNARRPAGEAGDQHAHGRAGRGSRSRSRASRATSPSASGWSGRSWKSATASSGGSGTICTTACASNWRRSPTGRTCWPTSCRRRAMPESAEAERSAGLVNEAIDQTRGRGARAVPRAPGGKRAGLGAGRTGRQRQQPVSNHLPLRHATASCRRWRTGWRCTCITLRRRPC